MKILVHLWNKNYSNAVKLKKHNGKQEPIQWKVVIHTNFYHEI